MYYKIGTLAKRFRISPQTIRYYEKLGFLKADRRDQSTTRYYHARNLKWLCSIRQYHGISMSPGDESVAHALRFAEENGLEIVGDALECCLAKVGEIECLQTDVIPGKIYYECYIPVRMKA